MNVLENKLPAKWRDYSPGGKRRRVVNVFYKNQLARLRAQGTKRVPVLASRFSYFSYMDANRGLPVANFAKLALTGGTGIRPISQYTQDELALLSPDQKRIAIEKQLRLEKEEERKTKSDARAGYRAKLDTVREGRGWLNTAKGASTELRGWLRTAQDFGVL